MFRKKVKVGYQTPYTFIGSKDQHKERTNTIYLNQGQEERLERSQKVLKSYHDMMQKHVVTDPFGLEIKSKLNRRFSNESIESGGRLYSSAQLGSLNGNYQGIPSAMRTGIRIDGSSTVEYDFKSMVPNMLLSLSKKPSKEYISKDIYDIKSLGLKDEEYKILRPMIKVAVSSIWNTNNPRSTEGAIKGKQGIANEDISQDVKDLFRVKLSDKALGYNSQGSGDSYKILVNRIEKHLTNIGIDRKYIYGKDRFDSQNMDSEIALKVVDRFVKNKKPILPIHDGFIVRKNDSNYLEKTMEESFKEYVKEVRKQNKYQDIGEIDVGVDKKGPDKEHYHSAIKKYLANTHSVKVMKGSKQEYIDELVSNIEKHGIKIEVRERHGMENNIIYKSESIHKGVNKGAGVDGEENRKDVSSVNDGKEAANKSVENTGSAFDKKVNVRPSFNSHAKGGSDDPDAGKRDSYDTKYNAFHSNTAQNIYEKNAGLSKADFQNQILMHNIATIGVRSKSSQKSEQETLSEIRNLSNSAMGKNVILFSRNDKRSEEIHNSIAKSQGGGVDVVYEARRGADTKDEAIKILEKELTRFSKTNKRTKALENAVIDAYVLTKEGEEVNRGLQEFISKGDNRNAYGFSFTREGMANAILKDKDFIKEIAKTKSGEQFEGMITKYKTGDIRITSKHIDHENQVIGSKKYVSNMSNEEKVTNTPIPEIKDPLRSQTNFQNREPEIGILSGLEAGESVKQNIKQKFYRAVLDINNDRTLDSNDRKKEELKDRGFDVKVYQYSLKGINIKTPGESTKQNSFDLTLEDLKKNTGENFVVDKLQKHHEEYKKQQDKILRSLSSVASNEMIKDTTHGMERYIEEGSKALRLERVRRSKDYIKGSDLDSNEKLAEITKNVMGDGSYKNQKIVLYAHSSLNKAEIDHSKKKEEKIVAISKGINEEYRLSKKIDKNVVNYLSEKENAQDNFISSSKERGKKIASLSNVKHHIRDVIDMDVSSDKAVKAISKKIFGGDGVIERKKLLDLHIYTAGKEKKEHSAEYVEKLFSQDKKLKNSYRSKGLSKSKGAKQVSMSITSR